MILIIVFIISSLATYPASAQVRGDQGHYRSTIDGDTITVDIPCLPDVFGKRLPVRLKGIDTPEILGKCEDERMKAREASTYLRAKMESAKRLDIVEMSRDRYFRIDARILADGEDVSRDLIEKGYARVYSGGARGSWCP